MYSKIANNSFSYLLTINEFRNQIPAEIRPSWIKITTITMVSSFVQAIDINKLRKIFNEIGSFKMRRDNSKMDGFEWKLKPTTFYNQVTLTYHDTYSTKSVRYSQTVVFRLRGVVTYLIVNVSLPNSPTSLRLFWV